MKGQTLLTAIEQMFSEYGGQRYTGLHEEPVSALEHALQCAALARKAGASRSLVAAALLHDIGHFLPQDAPIKDNSDDHHESTGSQWLGQWLPRSVTEPIRLHVDAKRYLCATNDRYLNHLSPASVHSLTLQGGVFTESQALSFIAQDYAPDAVRLRVWDDQAKRTDVSTMRLADYLDDVQHSLG